MNKKQEVKDKQQLKSFKILISILIMMKMKMCKHQNKD